jgi:hypothetical protein
MAESEAPETEVEILRRGAAILIDRLPSGWVSRLEFDVPRRPGPSGRIDGLIRVSATDGGSATLVLEARRILEGRDVGPLRDQLETITAEYPNSKGLLIARYLSPPVRAKLNSEGLSYIDLTGNIRVELQSPGLFISGQGADRDPWRGPGRPRGTLKGAPAAKIVRALADFSTPWTVRELVTVAKASTGATYRVVEYLEREGLVTRNANGLVSAPDWVQLLRRWSDDYGFVRNSRVTRWIAPRGVPELTKRIAMNPAGTRYVVTGSLAAAEWAAYAPARLAMVYVSNADEAAASWGLRPAEAGANVMLAEPELDVVFERPFENRQGFAVAAPTQVAVDLMTGPGRNPSEAEELLRWMTLNEGSWRE